MRQASALLLLVLVSHTYSAPQFITFKDGKLGVNFGGYHAGVGIGGLLGDGTKGGLYAEAGTPHGQTASAGLGGAAGSGHGATAGGLFANAAASEHIHASAGLGGGLGNQNNGAAGGAGYASAQSGNYFASTGMLGESSASGSTGFKYSGTNNNGVVNAVIKETDVLPVEHKKVHTELKLESANEVNPLPLSPAAEAHFDSKIAAKANAQPTTVLVKEVYVEPRPQIVEVHKVKTHYKPHHHHVHKTAYIGGYVGGGGDVIPSYQPVQKRIDVGVESAGNIGTIDASQQGYGGSQTTLTKEVTVSKNPSFFQDIFNIPIATLQSVGNFLSNSAANTKVSVQKSATVQAEKDDITSKHDPQSSTSPSTSSSDTHISVETPSVSQLIDNIFAIPINTLGAVNKFLENNVPARKRIQVQEGSEETARVRLGPHARRRANKKVIYVQQENTEAPIFGDDKKPDDH